MKSKVKPVIEQVGIRANAEEIAIIDWLKNKIDRKRSSAYKWAAKKVAVEMGYVPEEKSKEKKSRPS